MTQFQKDPGSIPVNDQFFVKMKKYIRQCDTDPSNLFSMSTLHVWYTKLKWSMDVLLRFYERHAFVCALHKETKLLFDELLYCLQRLYAINCQVTKSIHILLHLQGHLLLSCGKFYFWSNAVSPE